VTEGGRESPPLEGIARSTVLLTGGATVAQVVAIVRELFLAANVGVSSELDALLIAIVLPTTLAGVLTSGTVTALVPAYLEARATSGGEAARRFAGTVMVAIVVASIGLSIALATFSDAAIAVTGPGLSAASHEAAVGYLRLVIPLLGVAAVSSIFYSVCQAEEQFHAIALATVAGPVATLVILIGLWQPMRLAAFAAGSVIGSAVSLAILLVSTVRAGVVPVSVPRRDPRLNAFARHAAPLTLSSAILQVNVVGDRAIASILGPGAVSALRYAEVLVRVPIGAIAPAWGSALYPALVRSALGSEAATLGRTTEASLRLAITVFVPVAMLTAAVAPIAVSVAYGRGAFAPSAVALTAAAIIGFAPLLVILMVSPVLTGAHNARRRGSVLLIGGSINVVLNIALDIALGAWLGVVGVALASSITSTIVVIYFVRQFSRAEAGFATRPVARTLRDAVLASAPMTALVAAFAWTPAAPRDLAAGTAFLLVAALAGMAGYVVASRLLGFNEPVVLTARAWAWARTGRRMGSAR
jgi:putative peptidoglycan lipid II flippase